MTIEIVKIGVVHLTERVYLGAGLYAYQDAQGRTWINSGSAESEPLPTEPIPPPVTPPETTPPGTGPQGITGCALWLRADTLLTTHSNGDKIAFWGDQSGNARHATQTAGANNQPILSVSAFGSWPGVYFHSQIVGNDPPQWSQHLRFAGSAFTSLTAGEVFIVLKLDDDAPHSRHTGLWVLGDTAFNDMRYPNNHDDPGVIHDDFGSTTTHDTVDPAVSLDTAHIYNVTSVNGEWTSRINGTQIYTTATNTVGFAGSTASNDTVAVIGSSDPSTAEFGSGVNFKGHIAELLIFDHKLTTTDRSTALSYLSDKYGVAV